MRNRILFRFRILNYIEFLIVLNHFTLSRDPTFKTFLVEMPFNLHNLETVVLLCDAIFPNVSPFLIV